MSPHYRGIRKLLVQRIQIREVEGTLQHPSKVLVSAVESRPRHQLQELAIVHKGISSTKRSHFIHCEGVECQLTDTPGKLHTTRSGALFWFIICDAVNVLNARANDVLEEHVEIGKVLLISYLAILLLRFNRLVVGSRNRVHLLPGIVHSYTFVQAQHFMKEGCASSWEPNHKYWALQFDLQDLGMLLKVVKKLEPSSHSSRKRLQNIVMANWAVFGL
mmetsp:Transcript_36168/g.72012  ORF Transcript_36168/g.72012 Transcript_36168/m.72012 type:complete len:218 (+) Transcript_36168:740-1393(+)